MNEALDEARVLLKLYGMDDITLEHNRYSLHGSNGRHLLKRHFHMRFGKLRSKRNPRRPFGNFIEYYDKSVSYPTAEALERAVKKLIGKRSIKAV